MVFHGVLCMSRLSPRISRQVLQRSQIRSLSGVSLQHARPFLARDNGLRLPGHVRNYWWSSKSPAVPETSGLTSLSEDPIPPSPVSELLPAGTATVLESTPEQPLRDAAPLLDSTNASDISTALDTIPTDAVPFDLPAALSIHSLNYGDLAALGLAGWSPAGLCRWGIELLQVSTGMPWFWTIVTATVLSRVFLFPFAVKSIRSSASLAPYQNEVNAIRKEMQVAQAKRDTLGMQRVMLKQKMIYEKAGVSIGGMALMPIIQLPVALGMFFGVRGLCDYPLEQLKHSGLDLLPDLTIADPTYILPVASAVLVNLQLTLSMNDLTAAPHMAHVVNGFRVLSIVSIFLMAKLSTGVLVYLITSIVAMTFQSLMLRQPAVRRALGIPILPPNLQNKPASMMDTYAYVKKWFQDKKAEAAAMNRASRR